MATDYERVTEKLESVGAELVLEMNDETDELESSIQADFYNVSGRGLIVLGYHDGTCGLYKLVGGNGAPVEDDLNFIDHFSSDQSFCAGKHIL